MKELHTMYVKSLSILFIEMMPLINLIYSIFKLSIMKLELVIKQIIERSKFCMTYCTSICIII